MAIAPAWMASASGPRFVRTSAASLVGARARFGARAGVRVGARVRVRARVRARARVGVRSRVRVRAAIGPGGSRRRHACGRQVGLDGCAAVPVRALAHQPQQVRGFRPRLLREI